MTPLGKAPAHISSDRKAVAIEAAEHLKRQVSEQRGRGIRPAERWLRPARHRHSAARGNSLRQGRGGRADPHRRSAWSGCALSSPPSVGPTAVRLHITDGRSPAEIIQALAAIQLVAVAQPQYLYALEQQSGGDPAPASRGAASQGDEAQYILEKLSLADVHRMVKGTNVPIAVIDSKIDVTHPDLESAVAQRYDAVGVEERRTSG
jgi:hypothetical protein